MDAIDKVQLHLTIMHAFMLSGCTPCTGIQKEYFQIQGQTKVHPKPAKPKQSTLNA
jgi:hypothetical protein